DVGEPELLGPGEVGVPRARQRDLLRALPLRLPLRRPRAHPPRPVLVIAVAHDKRERRPERPPVAKAGEHLHLVGLDPLPGRAPVALLAPAKIAVDRLLLENEPRRQPREDRDERGPVGLPCRCELERHAGKPSALRITGTGAGTPVQSSNDAAPCATSTSRPSSTRAPARTAASAVADRGYGRSTSVCPGPTSSSTSSRTGVAFTTRSASLTSGGHALRRENTRACGSASRNAAAAPPSPTITGRSASSPARIAASVEKPCSRPSRRTSVFTDGRPAPTSSATAVLCGAVTFAPEKPSAANPVTASASRSGGTSSATYAQSSPRAAKAAFCIRGDS